MAAATAVASSDAEQLEEEPLIPTHREGSRGERSARSTQTDAETEDDQRHPSGSGHRRSASAKAHHPPPLLHSIDLPSQRGGALQRRRSSGAPSPLLWTALLLLLVVAIAAVSMMGDPAAVACRWLGCPLPEVCGSSGCSSSPSSCSASTSAAPASPSYFPLFPVPVGRSLVVVVHSSHDTNYPANLAYFIAKAVRCWQDADYVIVVQRSDAAEFTADNRTWTEELPPLPSNARYVLHANECMDIGSIGWLLRLPPSHPDHVDSARYRYFIFMNSSVRGPTLPAFLEQRMDTEGSVQCTEGVEGERGGAELFPWFHVFLAKLSAKVKLVGCTISCAFATHIQSYFLAMDYTGLQVIWQSRGLEATDIPDPALRQRFITHSTDIAQANTSEAQLQLARTPLGPTLLEADFCAWQRQGGLRALWANFSMVLACHVDYWDTVFNSEIGSTQAVLKAGYGIAALELYWREVDFRLAPDLCGRMLHVPPYSHYDEGVPADRIRPSDGVPLAFNDPQHVVFTKLKAKRYAGDAQLRAILAWEDLHNRTLAWQRTHNSTNRPVMTVSPHG